MKLLDRRDAGPVARTISPRNGGIVNCTRQHTVVTGASSGIGRATALRLVAARHHVYAGVRNAADGEELRRSVRSGARSGRDGTGSDATGGELTPVMLDVTNAGHIAEAAAMVSEHTADLGLAGLVNNAGIGLACPTELAPARHVPPADGDQRDRSARRHPGIPAVVAARTGQDRDHQYHRGAVPPTVRRRAGCDQGCAGHPGRRAPSGARSMGPCGSYSSNQPASTVPRQTRSLVTPQRLWPASPRRVVPSTSRPSPGCSR
jgi:hypothetical protein